MGTRGTFGVRIGGKDKLTYNHFDSYPDGLGSALVAQIKAILVEKGKNWLEQKAIALVQIDTESKPSPAHINALRPYADLSVGRQSLDDWYCLTRKLQGDIRNTLEAGVMIENNSFINDSLFCEWGYIINLDDFTFEVYEGFQTKPHKLGRYANNGHEDGYYPCALVAKFPLDDIPDGWEELVTMEEPEHVQ